MIKRKLKSFVVPAIYSVAIVISIFSMYLVKNIFTKNMNGNKNEVKYVDNEITGVDTVIPVISTSTSIIKPYTNNDVKIVNNFYNYQADAESQQNSILYYENTYMQNSGVDYAMDSEFDVVSILDGTVIKVEENDILGVIVEIRHTNDLISIYQSLKDVSVKVDDKVVQGQIIAKSGTSNINTSLTNHLHFELYHKGMIVNPEDYYNKLLGDL